MSESRRYFRFFRDSVAPRGRQVFLHENVLSSIVLSVIVVVGSRTLDLSAPFERLTFKDFSTATLAFAGLSFGGAMTSAALALTLPADRLMKTMVLNSVSAKRRVRLVGEKAIFADDGASVTAETLKSGLSQSLYLDLVFVFLLTGLAQLILAIVSMLCLAFVGESPLVPAEWSSGPVVALAVLVGSSSYALLQLGSALKTVMDVARQRDAFLRAEVLPPRASGDGASVPPVEGGPGHVASSTHEADFATDQSGFPTD